MRKYEGIRKWYEKISFRYLLTIIMVVFVSVVFISFSAIVVHLSESKIRQNTRDNMTIVMRQFDVYLGNHIANIFDGFETFETSQNLLQLREISRSRRQLSYAAGNYIYLRKQMAQFLSANSSSVYNIYINFGDGKVLTQGYEQDLLKIQYSYDLWKERFPENKYYWLDADSYRDLIPDPEVGAVLFHLYEGGKERYSGIILIAIKKSLFERSMDTMALDQKASLNIVTDDGIIHFGDEKACQMVKENQEYLMGKPKIPGMIATEVKDDYYFMYEDMDLTGWKLVYNVEESSISNAHYIKTEVILIAAFTIAVTSILIGILSKAISHSLSVLSQKVEAEDMLEHEISLHSYAEITTLCSSLEDMRLRINHLLHQIKDEQEAKRQTEIALLQEQINPHFLYNTLYSIMQLCELKQPEKASEMLSALSAFYRAGLNKGDTIITVEEELKHVKNYLYIQHFRYSDLFDYTIDCDPELLECRIPKMSLQPLVENAIYHGIKKKHGFGNICVLGGSYDGEHAYLEVHDDGPGISGERLKELRDYLDQKVTGKNKVSFGLKNVDSRIKFEFGAQAGLEIESAPEDTCVRIRFRMRTMKESGENNGREKK